MSKLRVKNQRTKHTGSRTEEKKDQVAHAIRLWALEQMHLKDNFIPAHKEVKLLFTDASSFALWEHVVKCIRPPFSANISRKNLKIHLGCLGNEGAGLYTKRLELVKELKSLQVAVSQMEVDIMRIESDIGKLVRENSMIQREVSEASRRKILLSAHSIKSQERGRILQEYTHRITQRKKYFCCLDQEQSYFARGRHVSKEKTDDGMVLESACMRSVREACEQMKALLAVGSRHISSETVQAQVWNKTESLLNSHAPSVILQCLCDLANDEANTIHSQTVSLDLSVDASELRYQLDHSVQESSVETTLFLKSVEDHLMEAQLAHIQRCIESERSRSAAELAQNSLEEIKCQYEEELWKQLPSDVDQVERGIMKTIFLQELEECGHDAILVGMSSLCSSLESAKTQSRDTIAVLQLKREQIDRFAEVSDKKQSQIRRLAKMNSVWRERLQRQRSELELYVKSNVCSHKNKLIPLGVELLDSEVEELELFSGLDLERTFRTPGVEHTPGLSTPTCELSIHRLLPSHPSGYPGWNGLLALLQLPPHTSPHGLLMHLMSSLHKVECLSSELIHQNKLILGVKQSAMDSHECKGVLQASHKYDNWLQDEGVGVVSKYLSLASKALAQCTTVQQTLEEWWEEPSQLSVPWISHEDMPFSKWLEQWRIFTAKLRQLSST